jgi:hypothetical protein
MVSQTGPIDECGLVLIRNCGVCSDFAQFRNWAPKCLAHPRTTSSRRNARPIMIAAISERPEQERKDQNLSPCPNLAGHK